MIHEGEEATMVVKVWRSDSQQALIEFPSMEGPFSVRVPMDKLIPVDQERREGEQAGLQFAIGVVIGIHAISESTRKHILTILRDRWNR